MKNPSVSEEMNKWNEMNGVLGCASAPYGCTGPETTWANGMNFIMNHVPGARFIARHVDQQSSMLPVYHRHPQWCFRPGQQG